MAKRSSKNNRRRGTRKVSRKASSKKDRLIGLSTEAIQIKWNPKRPIKENYAAAGYVAQVNNEDKIQESKPARLNPDQVQYMDLEELPELDIRIKSAGASRPGKVKKMSEDEVTYLKALVAKHGSDYKKMEKDIKLNSDQHSSQHLKTRIAKMTKEAGASSAAQDEELS